MLVEIIHRQHAELEELFLQHQEELVRAQLEDAIRRLARFHACLAAHMELEEEYLFPEFGRIERKSQWDVSLYEKEHAKIRKVYEHISAELEWLHGRSTGGSKLRRYIIALLDKEKTLKGMLEHHESREEAAMLQELDEQLPEKRLGELVAGINASWKEAIESGRQ